MNAGAETDWARTRAPDLAAFEDLAHAAFANLPLTFRTLCAGVVIHVEDFPDDETLSEMDCESEFDLLGLFRGIGLAQGGGVATGQMPNQVWLYRRPLLDYWAEHDETLGHLVTHVLVHEIGHHFGLSDDDMQAIEAAADA
ncbi:metallopeptidase family protein [Methylobacterium flocculans]|uniref:metallopeptidase family protein n=1 Tax=Methylobacterium flocculans TaxID=2984843 RepID=UPI0021F376B4|nr:metallopeptidase family protein [Methylobacterium sp. FF17]